MAAYHTRSNSLPSRQHPLVPEFDAQLSRLRSSEDASSSSTSLSGKLSGLQDLHDCLDKLLLLPLNQAALSKQQKEKLVDELLDGSLRLLDICNTAKDALQQTGESTQELRSIIRRRHGGESSLSSEVKKFLLNSRKVVRKALRKAMGNKCAFGVLNKDEEILSVLREVQSNSFRIIVFLHLRAKVEKLVTGADAGLNLLMSYKMKKSDNTLAENAQNELQKLEMCIQDLEEGVENLYRSLIKTRVSLLNILNH
ncbi:uncharacterized protein LOC21397507 [Morus notabilis]|nr:uncharacterized protein LOC21397507 [Morus notabilis]